MVKKDDRVRRLAGGNPRYYAALSARVAKGIKAKRHACQRNAVLACVANYGDVYVEGTVHDPEVQQYAPDWMRHGVLHAWCIKDGQIIDPTLNAYIVPEIEDIGHIQSTSVCTPLAVLTRGEILRALAVGMDHVWEVIDALGYQVPEGVGGWQRGDMDTLSAEVVAEAERKAGLR